MRDVINSICTISAAPTSSSGVVFVSDGAVILLTGSEIRGFFNTVVKGARPSQRPNRFKGSVAVWGSVAAMELGLGK